MRAGNGAEDQDQHHENGAGRERVCEQRQAEVAAAELGAHDAGANHGGEQKAGSDCLRDQPPCQLIFHALSAARLAPSSSPMSRRRWRRDNWSIDASGSARKRPIRLRRYLNAWTKAHSFSISVPSTRAGSSIPQWEIMGWPGHRGQVSASASAQTVKTKSMTGAPGPANSPQFLERRPSVG